MTTYNSYEAAKIANPDSDIYVLSRKTALMVGKFQAINDAPTSHFASGWTKCNPADHCMTVERFLADGHKFVEGDIYLNSNGRTLGVVNIPDYNNERSTIDCGLYILRAAALETKEPKRTKESYKKLDFNHAWEAVKHIENGGSFFVKKTEGLSPFWVEISHLQGAVADWKFAHERIETPIEWWEDASEFINQTDDNNCSSIMEGKLHVSATLTQDQWCDFARILLEQGE